MGRQENRLSARSAAAPKTSGRHADGGGLYLKIDGNRRRWVFLYNWRGKRKEMGLGGSEVPLAEARKARNKWRAILNGGCDPLGARAAERRAQDGKKTFGECATALIASKESAWRNAKHRWQWKQTLESYAAPLWTMPVDQVALEDVLSVLKPLWLTKPETASRLRGRIEATLDYAKVHGLRSGDNPARWRGHLDKLLPKRKKLTRGHHAAMPYAEVPAFLAELRKREAIAALALEFTILTTARSGEALNATWDEIDFSGTVWTIPANRMKASKEHRVPLCSWAVEILNVLAEVRTGEFVFPAQRRGMPLSSMAMTMLLRRMGIGVTVHGFRSAFRDWAGNETHFPRELAEQALAHRIGDSVEQAYRRSDALEKRRILMEAWASYCRADTGGKILKLKRAAVP